MAGETSDTQLAARDTLIMALISFSLPLPEGPEAKAVGPFDVYTAMGPRCKWERSG
jgi:hypothetical protein